MKLKKLLDLEPGPNKAVQLAAKLGVTEPYIRMIISHKAAAGWRLQRDIDAMYNDIAGTGAVAK